MVNDGYIEIASGYDIHTSPWNMALIEIDVLPLYLALPF